MARKKFRPIFKDGNNSSYEHKEITLVNKTQTSIWLISAEHGHHKLSLENTTYGRTRPVEVRPGDNAKVTLCKDKTSVYAWLTRCSKKGIPPNAYPDAAAVFDAEGNMIESLYSKKVLRFQVTGTAGVFWMAAPKYITVHNPSDCSVWYTSEETTATTINRQDGKYSGSALEIAAKSDVVISLLHGTSNSKFYLWLSSNCVAPMMNKPADGAVLLQNYNGAIIATSVDNSVNLKTNGDNWEASSSNGNGSSSTADWVWITLIIVAAVLILAALYFYLGGRIEDESERY